MGLQLSDLNDKQLSMIPADVRAGFGKAGVTSEEARKAEIFRCEKDLHREVRQLLNLRGIPFCEARMDRKSSITVGWPDITFAAHGTPVAWELKFRGSLSPDQVRVKEAMERHGWRYRVVRSLLEAREHLSDVERNAGF